MKELIIKKLQQFEYEREINILYACESGSRAWGFPSPNSDWDVRFIYVYPQEKYLGISEPQDNINLDIDENLLDFSAWELRKTLRLIRTSNVSPMEWSNSPITYLDKDGFQAKLQALTKANFIPKAAVSHYLGLCKKTWKVHLQESRVNLKKYFYALRPLLCAMWILKYETTPPLVFKNLFILLEDQPEVLAAIEQLLKQKETANESEMIRAVPVLQAFIRAELGNCKQAVAELEPHLNEVAPLDAFFRAYL